MNQAIIKDLWAASTDLKACRVILENEPFPRVILPYGVCQTSRAKIVVVCKQTAGFTKAGRTEGYRNLGLLKFQDVEILDESFESPSDFNPSDPQYGEWIYHI